MAVINKVEFTVDMMEMRVQRLTNEIKEAAKGIVEYMDNDSIARGIQAAKWMIESYAELEVLKKEMEVYKNIQRMLSEEQASAQKND